MNDHFVIIESDEDYCMFMSEDVLGRDWNIPSEDEAWKHLSKKDCACGGHNLNNVSRNLNHNSTKQRLSVKKNRRFIEGQKA